MRDLDMLRQYLTRLRQEKLQQAHASAVTAWGQEAFLQVKVRACEAELVNRITAAIDLLDKDPGEFIKVNLS